MDDTPAPAPEVRFLKILVTVLTGTMIAGLLVIIALFVIRFQQPDLTLPDGITLPQGAEAQAFTQGRDWYAIVSTDDQILIFDRDSGQLRQTVQIEATGQ